MAKTINLSVRYNLLAFQKHIHDDPHHRYRSWEHCYEYFRKRDSLKTEQEIDSASLHLAFYLASWGMYRGSSVLIWKDYKVHTAAVRALLDDQYKELWRIDFGAITPQRAEVGILFDLIDRLRGVYREIATRVNGRDSQRIPSDTLISKILLGTLACTPAYDRLVVNGIRFINEFPATFSRRNYLACIQFYQSRLKSFEAARGSVLLRHINYPAMKLVDMYFWSVGNQLEP
jgi:hypothetical protein